jgi:hypothetical protein
VRHRIAAIERRAFVGTLRFHARRHSRKLGLEVSVDHCAFGGARENICHAIIEAHAIGDAIGHFFATLGLQARIAIAWENGLATIGFFDVNRWTIQIEFTIVREIGASGYPKEKPER